MIPRMFTWNLCHLERRDKLYMFRKTSDP